MTLIHHYDCFTVERFSRGRWRGKEDDYISRRVSVNNLVAEKLYSLSKTAREFKRGKKRNVGNCSWRESGSKRPAAS